MQVLKSQLFVDKFSQSTKHSFLDYLAGGCEMNFMVAIDFTGIHLCNQLVYFTCEFSSCRLNTFLFLYKNLNVKCILIFLFGHYTLSCHLYHILIHALVLPFIHFNILVSVMLASLTVCFLISQHFIQSRGKIVLLVYLSTLLKYSVTISVPFSSSFL